MAASTTIKTWLNHALAHLGLKLDTLTRERAERARLAALDARGRFSQPVFALLPAVAACDPAPILEMLRAHRDRFDELADPLANRTGYRLDNAYFGSPDAEVLYCLIRAHAPRHIVEVGSGHSTRVSRLAIEDGALATRLVCIDPAPRQDVARLADELHRARVETLDRPELFDSLARGDVLFIDSSHDVSIGNDTVHLCLDVLPRLASGVLVHIHDVFLPYEYPREWVTERGMTYNEQYLVQALLQDSERFEVLWAGHYLQRTLPDFPRHFVHLHGRTAQSLWLRTR